MTHRETSARPSTRSGRRRSAAITALAMLTLLGTLLAGLPAQAASAAQISLKQAAWDGWAPLAGYARTVDAPATVNYRGKHYVFIRGTDNRLYHNVFDGYTWYG